MKLESISKLTILLACLYSSIYASEPYKIGTTIVTWLNKSKFQLEHGTLYAMHLPGCNKGRNIKEWGVIARKNIIPSLLYQLAYIPHVTMDSQDPLKLSHSAFNCCPCKVQFGTFTVENKTSTFTESVKYYVDPRGAVTLAALTGVVAYAAYKKLKESREKQEER